jgi:hypothetical protein
VTGKKIAVLSTAAALSLIALLVADWGLRTNSGWIGQERKKSEASQPFLANWVFPTKFQLRLQAQKIVDHAEEVDSQDARAALFFQAIDLLKDKDDAEGRAYLLNRICNECPDSPRCADAWVVRIREKIQTTPTSAPTDEINQLIACIQRLGVGEGKITAKTVEDLAVSMDATFPESAKALRDALTAATPQPQPAQ